MSELLKSLRKHVTLPFRIAKLVERRAKILGYSSVSGYILGLILYDLWCKKPHALTLRIVEEKDARMREAVYAEIAANFDLPERPSSYFEHRLKQLAQELAEEMAKKASEGEGCVVKQSPAN